MQNNLHLIHQNLSTALNSNISATIFSNIRLLKYLISEGGFSPEGDFTLGKKIRDQIVNTQTRIKILLCSIMGIFILNGVVSILNHEFSVPFFIGTILSIFPASYFIFKDNHLSMKSFRQDIVSAVLSLTSEQRNLLVKAYYPVSSSKTSDAILTFCKSSKMADEWRRATLKNRGELYYGDFLIMEALASLDAYFISRDSKNEVEITIRSSDPIFNS